MKKLGTFQVKSGKLIITDPCYSRGTWCQGIVDNVVNGKWEAEIYVADESQTNGWGERVAYLNAHLAGAKPMSSEIAKFKVGVDSGQAGIFDEAEYPNGELETERMKEYNEGRFNASFDEFYEEACRLTSDPHPITLEEVVAYAKGKLRVPSRHGGVMPFGVVTRSGYGDGDYEATIFYNSEKKVVGVTIDFGVLGVKDE